MNASEAFAREPAESTRTPFIDMKLEVVIVPVSDVDRAKKFYAELGWRLEADFSFDNGFRIVQFTPPGSGCSIQFGTKVTTAEPGSVRDFYLIVSDISTARKEIVYHSVDVSEVFPPATPGAQFQPDSAGNRVEGTDPGHTSYRSFATFSDPDGNRWLLQEVTASLPGRVAGENTYGSVADLSQALQRAAAAHGWHESQTGKADRNWPDWYAEFMLREQSGEELPR